jgi:hypothetical protein
VYCTRNPKGLIEFRQVEKRLFEEQHKVRAEAKQSKRVRRSNQPELFAAVEQDAPGPLAALRSSALLEAERVVANRLTNEKQVAYEALRAELLERSLVWESDLKLVLLKLKDEGRIDIRNMTERQRVPGEGHVIVAKTPPPEA